MAARRPPRDQVKPRVRWAFGTQRRADVYLRSRLLMSNAIAKPPTVASSLLACTLSSRHGRSPLVTFPCGNYFSARKVFSPRTPELPQRYRADSFLRSFSKRYRTESVLESFSKRYRAQFGGAGANAFGRGANRFSVHWKIQLER